MLIVVYFCVILYLTALLLFNSLGVLNTRLIKAYCEFDQRVVILIRLLKYWAREHHIPRLNLNSYALTLMMIYALQHCSPAVVPCLQEPNSWPLKGDKHDFHVENNVDPLLTYPSDVHFTSVQSLKPTLNSSSIGKMCVWIVLSC